MSHLGCALRISEVEGGFPGIGIWSSLVMECKLFYPRPIGGTGDSTNCGGAHRLMLGTGESGTHAASAKGGGFSLEFSYFQPGSSFPLLTDS
jgi:hypothetical protein